MAKSKKQSISNNLERFSSHFNVDKGNTLNLAGISQLGNKSPRHLLEHKVKVKLMLVFMFLSMLNLIEAPNAMADQKFFSM